MAGLITLGVVLALALYLCWLMVQPFINVVLWAAVLAVVFYPMHRRIQSRVPSPAGAAGLSTLLVIVLILLPTTFITIAVVRELAGAADNLQAGVQKLSSASTIPWVAWILERTGGYVDINPEAARVFIAERLQAWGGALAASTLLVVGGAVGAIVQMVLVVFTMFYMFRDGDAITQAVYRILPLERIQMHDITVRTQEVIGATIYGVLVIAAIQGTLGALIFSLLGLPSPLLWGVVMFFLSMIPMAGSFLVWIPAAIYLGLTGEYVKAGMLVAWGAVVIGSIDNFLSPRLVGRRARLHELLIFFSVLGGLQVFGVLGLVLGPVVVAVTLALIEMVRQAHRPPAETLPEKTVMEKQSDLRATDV
ncbi:MAG: AI-2E family transporter [Acidobacteriota bacterium]|nr:AI-2E family transporter [Acidobacteriota bacterium]MDQ3418578.1 AI-2E family transporter [Acidobacteriota bacterium]